MDNNTKIKLRQSYNNCLMSDIFFERFYTLFFEKCPQAKIKFETIDMSKQRYMLAEGITKLLAFAESDGEPSQRMKDLAIMHSKENLDINPSFYPPFIEALLTLIKNCNPGMEEELVTAWTLALKKGTDYFISKY